MLRRREECNLIQILNRCKKEQLKADFERIAALEDKQREGMPLQSYLCNIWIQYGMTKMPRDVKASGFEEIPQPPRGQIDKY